MKFREDWRQASKFISIRAAAAQAAFLLAWAQLPDDLKSYIPHWLGTVVALALVLVGVLGVLVVQKESSNDPQ